MSEEQRGLTPADRAELRRRHSEALSPRQDTCLVCRENYPCQTIRALDALERAERAVERLERIVAWRYARQGLATTEQAIAISDLVFGGATGPAVVPILDELTRETEAVIDRVVERVRQGVLFSGDYQRGAITMSDCNHDWQPIGFEQDEDGGLHPTDRCRLCGATRRPYSLDDRGVERARQVQP